MDETIRYEMKTEIYLEDDIGGSGENIRLFTYKKDRRRPSYYTNGDKEYVYCGEIGDNDCFYTIRHADTGLLDFNYNGYGEVSVPIYETGAFALIVAGWIIDKYPEEGIIIEEWQAVRHKPLESKISVTINC